jgi:hypothetical protein
MSRRGQAEHAEKVQSLLAFAMQSRVPITTELIDGLVGQVRADFPQAAVEAWILEAGRG